MKRHLLTIALLLLCGMTAGAYSIQHHIGTMGWRLETTTGELRIYRYNGDGAMVTDPLDILKAQIVENNSSYVSYNEYEQYIKTLVVEDGVPGINSFAFNGLDYLTTVTLGADVKTIGSRAFMNCPALTTVTINGNVTSIGMEAFVDCKKLSSINLGTALTTIGEGAFESCQSLTSITIPKSVTTIGKQAFYKAGLETIYFSSNPTLTIGERAFQQCHFKWITLPDCLTEISDYMFQRCSLLTSITLPKNVKTIGAQAFTGCSELVYVQVAGSLTSIGDYAFNDCISLMSFPLQTSLTSIGHDVFANTGFTYLSIPEGLTSLPSYAYYGCKKLATVILPGSMTYLGSQSFANCPALTELTVGSGLTSINDKSFIDTENISTLHWNCDLSPQPVVQYCGGSLATVEIGGSATSVAEGAFSGCANLTTLTLGNKVKTIGKGAFSGCLNLSSVTLPNSLTSIGDEAFKESGLTAMTFNAGLTTIGEDAFAGCAGLTSISLSYSVKTLGYGAFRSTGLTAVTFPYNMTEVGPAAFKDCTSLADITLSDAITTLGDEAFAGCTALTTLAFTSHVSRIGDRTFAGCTGLNACELPTSLTSIGDEAFTGCTGLTDVSLPSRVSGIGEAAFAGCTALASIALPSHLTSLGSSAFRNCSSLTSIVIPDGLQRVPGEAFAGCTGLTTVVIKEGVEGIDDEAFAGCGSLSSLTIPQSLNSIGYGALSDCELLTTLGGIGSGCHIEAAWTQTVPEHLFSETQFLTSVIVPDGVATIERDAFSFSSVRTIVIPKSVKLINGSAFQYSALQTVKISSEVEDLVIGSMAFNNCALLTDITLPAGVKSIGDMAFNYCTELTDVCLKGAPFVGEEAFYGCDTDISCLSLTPPATGGDIFGHFYGEKYEGLHLYVKPAATAAYMADAVWSRFDNIGAYEAPSTLPGRYKAAAGDAWTPLTTTNGTLTIDDGIYALEVDEAVEVDEVAYIRKFGTDKWQSLYLPFDANVADLEGKFDVAYVNNFVQYADDEGNIERSSVEIVQIGKGTLRAGTPYFIRAKVADSNNAQVMTFHNVTLRPTDKGDVSHVESSVSMAEFYGTFTTIDKSVTTADHLFLVSGGDWKWLNQNVKCFRTYMKLTPKDPMFIIDPNAAISIRVIGEEYDDDATGIFNENENENENGNGNVNGNYGNGDCVVYDLQGRRVDNPQRGGLYIVGGRKIILK